MYQCCAPLCSSKSESNDARISFFRFPKDKHRCEAWLKITGNPKIKNLSATTCHTRLRLCSLHFEEHCFYGSMLRNSLKSTAIPTLFYQALQDEDNSVTDEQASEENDAVNDLLKGIKRVSNQAQLNVIQEKCKQLLLQKHIEISNKFKTLNNDSAGTLNSGVLPSGTPDNRTDYSLDINEHAPNQVVLKPKTTSVPILLPHTESLNTIGNPIQTFIINPQNIQGKDILNPLQNMFITPQMNIGVLPENTNILPQILKQKLNDTGNLNSIQKPTVVPVAMPKALSSTTKDVIKSGDTEKMVLEIESKNKQIVAKDSEPMAPTEDVEEDDADEVIEFDPKDLTADIEEYLEDQNIVTNSELAKSPSLSIKKAGTGTLIDKKSSGKKTEIKNKKIRGNKISQKYSDNLSRQESKALDIFKNNLIVSMKDFSPTPGKPLLIVDTEHLDMDFVEESKKSTILMSISTINDLPKHILKNRNIQTAISNKYVNLVKADLLCKILMSQV